jgi:cysteine desulfurase
VDRTGWVDPEDVRRAITPQTMLVSIMHVNSEIGTIAPLADIGAITRERGVLFHSDAVQSVGKIPVDVEALQVDLLSISGHEIYGPKGVGALYIRHAQPGPIRLEPIVHGGGHERGVRSGTLNVPGIVGLGKACAVCQDLMPAEGVRLGQLRQRLYAGLTARLDDVVLNGHPELRVPGNLNLCFARVQDESLLLSLKDIVALSAGSACTSDSHEPSYVIQAIGVEPYLAHSAIRFGLGRHTTEAQIDTVIDAVVEKVRRLRALAPSPASVSSGS